MTSPFGMGRTRTARPSAAVGDDLNAIVTVAASAMVVTAVSFTPLAAITGADTNSRTLSLVNTGAANGQAVVVASLALVAAVNATANTPKAITLSATAANLIVAAGDVLVWKSTHIGTGIADPGGLVSVTANTQYA